jgi:hypothetical protein
MEEGDAAAAAAAAATEKNNGRGGGEERSKELGEIAKVRKRKLGKNGGCLLVYLGSLTLYEKLSTFKDECIREAGVNIPKTKF